MIGIGAAAAILIAVFILPGTGWRTDDRPWKELASNERSAKVLLEDGSVVVLAPHSVLQVHPDFLRHRSLRLVRGAVYSDIARDEQHRLSIAVNRQQVIVLGTAFSIHQLDSVDIQLTVKEGKVALDNEGGRRLLTAGQQIRTDAARTGAIRSVDPAAADWWVQRQARWKDIPLEEILDRVEDYYQVRLSHGIINKNMKLTLTWDLSIPLKENLAVLNSLTGYNIH